MVSHPVAALAQGVLDPFRVVAVDDSGTGTFSTQYGHGCCHVQTPHLQFGEVS